MNSLFKDPATYITFLFGPLAFCAYLIGKDFAQDPRLSRARLFVRRSTATRNTVLCSYTVLIAIVATAVSGLLRLGENGWPLGYVCLLTVPFVAGALGIFDKE